MFGRYWLSLIVVVGLITCAGALAQPQQKPDNQKVEKQTVPGEAQQQQTIEPPPVAQVVPSAVGGQSNSNQSQNEEQGETDYKFLGDTPAQWVMAAAALLALGLGVWTLVLLARTLIATKQAAEYARVAADATQEAVIETRRIGEAQVRAYPAYRPLKTHLFTTGEINDKGKPCIGDKVGVRIEGVMKNTGQSPARRIGFRFKIFEIETGSPITPIGQLSLKGFPLTEGELGGGIEQPQFIQDTVSISLDRLVAGHTQVRVAGELSYEDVFGFREKSYFDGIIQNMGAFIGHFNAKGTVADAPDLKWEWTKLDVGTELETRQY